MHTIAIIAGAFAGPEAAISGGLKSFLAWLQGIAQDVLLICLVGGILAALVGEVFGLRLIPKGKVGNVLWGVFFAALGISYGPAFLKSLMAGA